MGVDPATLGEQGLLSPRGSRGRWSVGRTLSRRCIRRPGPAPVLALTSLTPVSPGLLCFLKCNQRAPWLSFRRVIERVECAGQHERTSLQCPAVSCGPSHAPCRSLSAVLPPQGLPGPQAGVGAPMMSAQGR